MSMGWLTESALVPKKSRAIEVHSGSNLALKAAFYQKHSEAKAGVPSQRFKHIPFGKKDIFGKKNPGVEERARAEKESIDDDNVAARSYDALQRKANIYNGLVKGQVGSAAENFLIDFERKGWDQEDAARASAKADSSRPGLGRNNTEESGWLGATPGSSSLLSSSSRQFTDWEEREKWEQATLREINEELKGINSHATSSGPAKNGVTLAYDKRLSVTDKDVLASVMRETERAREEVRNSQSKREIARQQKRSMIAAKNQGKASHPSQPSNVSNNPSDHNKRRTVDDVRKTARIQSVDGGEDEDNEEDFGPPRPT